MSFSRAANPIWLFVDLVGNILDDSYYISFLENTIPYLPQPVFMSSTGDGNDPWPNPLEFYPNGTLPDNLYFQEGLTYRLEIRQGPTSADPLIYLIENFIVGEGIVPPVDGGGEAENQITNPQFAFVSFNGTTTISNTGTNTYNVAPGWYLDVVSSGASTITLEQVAIAGEDNVPTDLPSNPGYALKVSVTAGIVSTLNLRQRFEELGAIWAQQRLSITYAAKMDAGAATLAIYYKPSTTQNPSGQEFLISSETISTVYQTYFGGLDVPESTNSDSGEDAYVDIIFKLPIAGTIFLTSIQAVGSESDVGDFSYEQTTVERQKDHTYHYYADSLLEQPKANILVGWTFAINPWQFRTTTSSNLANNAYTADQTIIVQQKYVLDGTANNIAVGRAAVAENYAFEVKAVTATNRFAIIQYIDPTTARPYWGQKLSAMVKAQISTSHSTLCRFKMRLIYRSSLPAAISQTNPIASWAAATDSEPVMASGWTMLTPQNDPIYTFGDGTDNFSFDQFVLPAADNAAMTLGIMLFTLNETSQVSTADRVLFNRVSLVPNDFAIDAAPQTFDECLRKCEYYYEKSYAVGTLPGTASQLPGLRNYSLPVGANGTATTAYLKRMFLQYKQTKRTVMPTITLYSYAGTINNLSVGMNNNLGGGITAITDRVATQWTLESISDDSANYSPNATSAVIFNDAGASVNFYEGITQFHYTIDARLGV